MDDLTETPIARPDTFTWIEQPLLGAMARPDSLAEFTWLRKQGIDLLISLTETPPRRDWINDAGLMVLHIPVEDMEPPTQVQLDRCISAIHRANGRKMGVLVHCSAGLGRTGVILACYLVSKGMTPANAISRVRRLRPGSIETDEQAEAVSIFARRQRST
jgi:atypical dual specificity phosphatase